ncbi:MAG: YcaQ family DNA glycosylase [Erysipelotrichaceae bacterium]|nr:YcaQ family DNA glycosylase [Erysipelotrichaceae bacterium]
MDNNIRHITVQTARRYLLMKQGLFSDHRFKGKQGAYEYIRQANCLQFDPVDVIGRNAELTLQSRVKSFRKKHLSDLLYKGRKLFDFPDKEISIIPMEDWPYFQRYRDISRNNRHKFENLEQLEEQTISYIRKHGPVSSSSLPLEGNIKWYSSIHWSGSWDGKDTKAARSVLEQLYTTGELIIHHKEGSRKYYDLSERHVPAELLNAPDPLPDEYQHIRWRVKRRIGAVGMVWNKNSAAFLGIRGLNTEIRNRVFIDLLTSKEIQAITVEGIKEPFYILTEDMEYLNKVEDKALKSNRCEFLAPLDPMLWDRNLIKSIFNFNYTWEIYVPKDKRKYGYYVLPVVYGDRIVGRIEPKKNGDEMTVENIWLEPDIKKTKRILNAIEKHMKSFARFNDCQYTTK